MLTYFEWSGMNWSHRNLLFADGLDVPGLAVDRKSTPADIGGKRDDTCTHLQTMQDGHAVGSQGVGNAWKRMGS